ncbi:hypothetical protein [Sulfuricurvum sp.]|uniref:hypothetical protein n=1 Tax=Sulfuricurvum sp. TaxID=2025608 RepID=UPI002E316283|nr:hypothetical protein [Sulfuricurvum sp.]HEX5330348.1 hypothetical protein [Sulfuricurvum sp.]
MLSNTYDVAEHESVLKRLKGISTSHMIVAYRAKMSNYEILLCQEISSVGRFPLIDVMEKMAAFKQTSEHILYKKDFVFI